MVLHQQNQLSLALLFAAQGYTYVRLGNRPVFVLYVRMRVRVRVRVCVCACVRAWCAPCQPHAFVRLFTRTPGLYANYTFTASLSFAQCWQPIKHYAHEHLQGLGEQLRVIYEANNYAHYFKTEVRLLHAHTISVALVW